MPPGIQNGSSRLTRAAIRDLPSAGANDRYHGPVEPIEDVVIVGAGPAGLAVAIAGDEAGLSCELVEKGVLVNAIFNFPHGMPLLTTPELLEMGGCPSSRPTRSPRGSRP